MRIVLALAPDVIHQTVQKVPHFLWRREHTQLPRAHRKWERGYLVTWSQIWIGSKKRYALSVCLGSKAALTAPKSDFCFTLEVGLKSDIAPCPKSAKSGRANSL